MSSGKAMTACTTACAGDGCSDTTWRARARRPELTYCHGFPGPQALEHSSGSTALSLVLVSDKRWTGPGTMPGLPMVVLSTSGGSNNCGRRGGSTLTGVGVATVVVV